MRLWLLALAVFLTSCGGGGGGASGSNTANLPQGNGLTYNEPPAWGVPQFVANAFQEPVGVALFSDQSALITLVTYGGAAGVTITFVHQRNDGVTLHSVTRTGVSPQVTSNPNGRAIVSWMQNDAVTGVRRLRTIPFSTLGGFGAEAVVGAELPGYAGSEYNIGIDAAGNATAVWLERGTLPPPSTLGDTAMYLSNYDSTTGWSTASMVVSPRFNLISPVLSRAPSGETAFAWVERATLSLSGPVVIGAVASASGGWQTTTLMDPSTYPVDLGDDIMSIQIATTNAGNAMVVWGTYHQFTGRSLVQYRRYEKVAGWLDLDLISDSGSLPSLAMNPFGVGFVSWTQESVDVAGFPRATIAAARFTDAGFDGIVSELSPQVPLVFEDAYQSYVAIDETGQGVAFWNQVHESNKIVVRGSRFNAGAGTWSPHRTLSSLNEPAVVTPALSASNGRSIAIWKRGDLGGGSWTSNALRFGIP